MQYVLCTICIVSISVRVEYLNKLYIWLHFILQYVYLVYLAKKGLANIK